MIIYPAIDLKEGHCVRLKQGVMEDSTTYSKNPAHVARLFERAGVKWIHVVDLNGAFEGKSVNEKAIRRIVKAVKIPIQLGGGIRTLEDIARVLSYGVSRVILGTVAVKEPDIVTQAVELYGDKIAVGIDARDGRVAINGWVEKTDLKAIDFAQDMKARGVKTIIHTDISKDGMMDGPNIKSSKDMIDDTGLDIIVSGGISTLNDIRNSRIIGAAGVITGKAIYTGAIKLSEALRMEG
jgi:phosphoribosylformimino-5-aminoimidazole carboxamide ribotide isomerase